MNSEDLKELKLKVEDDQTLFCMQHRINQIIRTIKGAQLLQVMRLILWQKIFLAIQIGSIILLFAEIMSKGGTN